MSLFTKIGKDICSPVDGAGNQRGGDMGEFATWMTEIENLVSGNPVGMLFNWDTGTADADPGAGDIRANNADLSAATTLYISKTNRGGSNVAAFLASLDDSTSTIKGKLIVSKLPGSTLASFDVGAVTDATGYIKLAVSGHSGETSFTAADIIAFYFAPTGDKGDTGATGATGPQGDPGPTGSASSNSTFSLTGILTPPQITADQNNYNPTSLSTNSTLRLSSDASRNVTGLAASVTAGEIKILANVGLNDIILKDESLSSTDVNRFAFPNGDITLTPDSELWLRYDGTMQRWRQVGGSGSVASVSETYFNVKNYGAIDGSAATDTATIQAAAVAAKAAGGIVFAPAGNYVCNPLDFSGGLSGFGFMGETHSPVGTRIQIAAGCAGKHVFDLTGTYNPILKNFRIADVGSSPQPKTGIFIAPKSGGNALDIVTLRDIFVGAEFTEACIYAYGVTSSGWLNVIGWNYADLTNSRVGVFTRVNARGLTSDYQTVAAGDQGGSSVLLDRCEWHHHKQAGGATTAATLYFGGIVDVEMVGGNVAGSSSFLIDIQTESAVGCARFLSDNQTFYSENGTNPSNIFNLNASLSGLDIRLPSMPAGVALYTGSGYITTSTQGADLCFKSAIGSPVAGGATVYLGPAGHSATEDEATIIVSRRGFLHSLYAALQTAPGAGQSATYTVRKPGGDTALTCTISDANTAANDTSHSVLLSPGDIVNIKLVTSVSAASGAHRASVAFTPF